MNKKRLICLILALAVIMSIAAVSFAAESRAARAGTGSYNFNVPYPLENCAQVSSPVKSTGGMSPWVKPSIYSTSTMYWLYNTYSGATLSGGMVTNTVTTSSPGAVYFTYKSNHGGSGYTYNLVGGSAVFSYTDYTVYGTWSPD